jgi:hypothetical protein
MERFYQWISEHDSSTKYEIMYWMIMPRVRGNLLNDWEVKTAPSLFDVTIAVQVAQALCVAQHFKLMHHDLHGENIIVQQYSEPVTFDYEYPVRFSMTTTVSARIFDYDLAFMYGTTPNHKLDSYYCESRGLCNEFRPKYDWNLFLGNLVKLYKDQHVVTSLETYLVNDTFQEPFARKDRYVAYGRACKCKEIDPNERQSEFRCMRCLPDAEIEIVSPKDFILSMIYAHPTHFRVREPTVTIHHHTPTTDMQECVSLYEDAQKQDPGLDVIGFLTSCFTRNKRKKEKEMWY